MNMNYPIEVSVFSGFVTRVLLWTYENLESHKFSRNRNWKEHLKPIPSIWESQNLASNIDFLICGGPMRYKHKKQNWMTSCMSRLLSRCLALSKLCLVPSSYLRFPELCRVSHMDISLFVFSKPHIAICCTSSRKHGNDCPKCTHKYNDFWAIYGMLFFK